MVREAMSRVRVPKHPFDGRAGRRSAASAAPWLPSSCAGQRFLTNQAKAVELCEGHLLQLREAWHTLGAHHLAFIHGRNSTCMQTVGVDRYLLFYADAG